MERRWKVNSLRIGDRVEVTRGKYKGFKGKYMGMSIKHSDLCQVELEKVPDYFRHLPKWSIELKTKKLGTYLMSPDQLRKEGAA